jgi:competence protein ComEA
MLESTRARAVAALLAMVVLAGAAVLAWRLATTPGPAEAVAAEAARARGPAPPPAALPASARLLTVFVSGEVLRPGVYRLARGARVADAIDLAGGLLPDADASRLPNLAARVSDGKEVKVPRRGSTTASASRLDINTATLEELASVPGMDAATAEAIINEREGYGPFSSLSELHSLLGLDNQVVAELRPYLRVVVP